MLAVLPSRVRPYCQSPPNHAVHPSGAAAVHPAGAAAAAHAVLPAIAEPRPQPPLHLEDLSTLVVADGRRQDLDLFMVGHTAHQQPLRHHDRAHVVPEHVLQERAVEPVPIKAGQVLHHRVIGHPTRTVGVPLGEPLLHLVDLSCLRGDDHLAEVAHRGTFRAFQLPCSRHRLLMVGDHLGKVGVLATRSRPRPGAEPGHHPAGSLPAARLAVPSHVCPAPDTDDRGSSHTNQ
jgi:hypothetical protein